MFEHNRIEEGLTGSIGECFADALAPQIEFSQRRARKKHAREIEPAAYAKYAHESPHPDQIDLPFHPATRLRLEEHNLLVSEVAFALLISLAGVCRIRPSDGNASPPASRSESQLYQFVSTTSDTPGDHQKQSTSRAFSSIRSDSPTCKTDGFNPLSLERANIGRCAPELRSTIWWEPNSVSRLYEDELMNSDQQNFPSLSMRKRATSLQNGASIGRKCVKIQIGDTLANICERYFHDAALAPLLADINRGKIRDDNVDGKRIARLRLGQEVLLPSHKDIAHYRQAGDTRIRSQTILTIIDSEGPDGIALNSQLKTLVSPALPTA